MAGYTKLFASILTSTIWQQDADTRVVWITLLALADKRGIAEGSIPGLARFAGVSLEECKRALEILSGPDEYSRTPDHDGRRIKAVDGGWLILNHGKYREKMSIDEKREYQREWVREKRSHASHVDTSVDSVDSSINKSTMLRHASASASASSTPKESEAKDVSSIVSQIGHLHPANAHLKSQLLPQRHELAIAEAIHADGIEVVLKGTQVYAEAVKHGLKFTYGVERFFGPEKHYLKTEKDWPVTEGSEAVPKVEYLNSGMVDD